MSDTKKPPKKAVLCYERDAQGFFTPSGAVNPLARPNKPFDLLDTPPGSPCYVQGRWPGGRPR
jgi:hypothetical protein